jgi:hypothetical protein
VHANEPIPIARLPEMEEPMLTKSVCVLGLVTTMMLAVGACGSGSDSGPGAAGAAGHAAAGGSGGGASSSSAACYAYCMARETKKDCSPDKTVDDCVGYTFGCSDFDTHSSACQNALKAYWNCTAAQADPCDNPGSCGSQGDAVAAACAS